MCPPITQSVDLLSALNLCLSNDLLGNLSVSLHDDLVDLLRRLDRFGLIVDPLELLESATLGLDAVVAIFLAHRPLDF